MSNNVMWMLLTIITEAASTQGPEECTHLQCENNSPCMTSYIRTENGSIITRERCICSQNYYGPHCDMQISIYDVTVTSQEAHVHTQILCNDTRCSGKELEPEVYYEYSLQYWTNNSELSCSVHTFYGSKTPVLSDLLPTAEYIVCIKSGSLNWCRTFDEAVNLTKNCVFFKTGSSTFTQDRNGIEYILLLVLFIFLAITLAILIFVCRRQTICRGYSRVPNEININLDQEFSLSCILESRTMQHKKSSVRLSNSRIQRKRNRRADAFSSLWTLHENTGQSQIPTECNNENFENETSNMLCTDNIIT